MDIVLQKMVGAQLSSTFKIKTLQLMWFKRNGHFAKNEISESEVSNEYSKNQTEFHPRVQG